MQLRALLLTALFASFSLAGAPASAQQLTARQDAEARTLFGLGNTAYQEGRFRAALDYFQQAYDLSQRPQLLFNIGQAADRLRDDRRALEAFERYLTEVPESPDREAIEARVLILRETIARTNTPTTTGAEEAPEPEEAAAPEPSPLMVAPQPADEGSSTPGIIVASGGGAVTVVGVIFLALGLADASDVEGAPAGSDFADVSAAYDRAPTRIVVGSILAGVGLAATATGIVLATRRGGSDASSDTASLRLSVQPTGLSLRGSF